MGGDRLCALREAAEFASDPIATFMPSQVIDVSTTTAALGSTWLVWFSSRALPKHDTPAHHCR
jgi:hypothetical protein